MKFSRTLALLLLLSCASCQREAKETGSKAAVEPSDARTSEAPKRVEAAPSVVAEPFPWATRRTPQGAFPCEVEEILAQSCRRCHWEPQENDAPFGMLSVDALHEERSGKPVYQLMKAMVSADLMPPLDALVTPDVTPLAPEQKTTLLAWLEAGAPKADKPCTE